MKVQILLADKGTANPAASTLNLLNVGWNMTMLQSPAPGVAITPPHAVAIFFEVETSRCNRPLEMVLSLVTDDGQPVEMPGPVGPQRMELREQITIPTPGGVPIGTPGTGNRMLEIHPGLPLTPGGYQWRVSLDGQEHEDWSARFQVMPAPQGATFGMPPTAE